MLTFKVFALGSTFQVVLAHRGDVPISLFV